ncbi:MAG TPA: hypothetical protein VMW76_10180 [Bacteroidales bacterium]|nr:hypothetical protein [Bacteroidales bacterium]
MEGQRILRALATLWYLVKMGGLALTDIEIWKWMYANPDETSMKYTGLQNSV